VRIELPVDAHLPSDYIESERLRLEMYKRLAEVRSEADVKAVEAELHDRYGTPPAEVLNLIAVARFRLLARSVGLVEIVGQGRFIRLGPAHLAESRVMRLQRLYPHSVVKDAVGLVLVPRPTSSTEPSQPLQDTNLLNWVTELIRQIFASS
jgi:transcription-repair coupling factor (superfamily II helicase)